MAAKKAPGKNNQEAILAAVARLAESCQDELGHSHQVTRLALLLFDELTPLHKLGTAERFWLQCAGLLHDIGWVEGQPRHHKTALRIILDTPMLPFDRQERLIIGSVARYHRKALPDEKHPHFAALKPVQRQVVSQLAALLRVADGLDCSHQGLVKTLACKVTARQIRVQCEVLSNAEAERLEAIDKGALLEQVFARKLAIDLRQAKS